MTLTPTTELTDWSLDSASGFGEAVTAEPTTFADEYADPARYDLEYGQANGDIPFYLSLAEVANGPVLDLACGTGRVALSLAQAGYAVTAVDSNEAMLERASSKYGADEVAWVEQDARELQLRSKFGLVLVAGNAFQQFLTNQDRDAVLKAIYRQLKPGGTCAVSVRFPHPADLARQVEIPEIWHTYLDAEGFEVVVSGTSLFDPIAQVATHHTYRAFASTGLPAAAPTVTQVRYTFPQEFEAALKSARFQVTERLGAFDGTELSQHAVSMIYVCHKPESTRRSA